MSARPPELRALTGARGIAAWLVVLYHIRLSIAGLPASVVAVLAKGYLAVDFFFLLSGFVIWLAWHERLRDGDAGAVRRFWWKRVARVWPLHLLMLALAVAIAIMLAATGRSDGGHFPFAELPLHVALIQEWGFTDRLTWNDPAWSISAEWGAYLLFPVLIAVVDWRRLPTAAVLAAIGALFVLLHAVFAGHGATSLGFDIARLGLARCLIEFAAGTALCELYGRWRERPALPAAIAAGGGVLLFGAAATQALPETLAIPAAFAALLMLLALTSGWRRNPLATRPLHLLGEISFATYLSHFLLFLVFKLALVDDPRAVPAVLIALYLTIVLAASFALYQLWEKPAQRWIETLPTRLATRARRPEGSPAPHG
ncbi:acyltransferase family protein [uncultured Sphingomonas sp.]|uniref:acyltransferase family protein n=1 Tax=uncultured Sphingomonas sp. TaxID=158754 RepID=UPI0035C96EF3